jgi:hypothetical protein
MRLWDALTKTPAQRQIELRKKYDAKEEPFAPKKEKKKDMKPMTPAEPKPKPKGGLIQNYTRMVKDRQRKIMDQ